MKARNGKAILTMCAVLSVAVLPVAWVGCAGNRTHESTGEYVDDSTITTKVKAAFVKDPVVSAFAVSVETFKGVVQLSGFVNTQAARDRAEEIARPVRGVKSVANNIIIKAD